MQIVTDIEALRSRLPDAAWPVIAQWLREDPIRVRITRPRRSKLGDYRSGAGAKPPRISVNGDLNPFTFLVTLVHEFAHHEAFLKHRRSAAPHGAEWKGEYQRLMRPFLSPTVLPADVLVVLEHHLRRAPASSCSDPMLMRALMRYDAERGLVLEQLPERAVFKFHDRIFVKGPRLRKRFRCRCLNDGRTYFIDPLVDVSTASAMSLAMAS